MDYINRICETEIKLSTSQFWPVFTFLSLVVLFIGGGGARRGAGSGVRVRGPGLVAGLKRRGVRGLGFRGQGSGVRGHESGVRGQESGVRGRGKCFVGYVS
jgi:hypothetical protein